MFVLIRGAGDLASGVALRLARAGYRLLLTEIEQPLAVRWTVSFSQAAREGLARVEGQLCRKISSTASLSALQSCWEAGEIPLIVDPELRCLERLSPVAILDLILAKKNCGLKRGMAELTVGFGPGFEAGVDCDAVVETMRGHSLGRIYTEGTALPNTGVPAPVQGFALERLLKAPMAGRFETLASIGEEVQKGQLLARLRSETAEGASAELRAEISGRLRGLLPTGSQVQKGLKVGDIDPRAKESYCHSVSDKAMSLGGAALELLLQRRIFPTGFVASFLSRRSEVEGEEPQGGELPNSGKEIRGWQDRLLHQPQGLQSRSLQTFAQSSEQSSRPEGLGIQSSCSGCGAKMGADVLSALLDKMKQTPNPRLLVGFDKGDDAAAYLLNDEQIVLSTVDFFPSPLENPYQFGRLAATNALSDIYAMGGEPVNALNLLAAPKGMNKKTLEEVLRGGLEVLQEAKVSLAGGHSIYDDSLKYGLAVTGLVSREGLWKNHGLKEGDVLYLSKRLGIGVLLTAFRGGLITEQDEAYQAAIGEALRLNKATADCLRAFKPSAVTDVTGFGLAGHLKEMISPSPDLEVVLDSEALPLLPSVLDYAALGLLPEAVYNNRRFAQAVWQFEDGISEALQDLCFDPQTSGGLLIALSAEQATTFEQEMHKRSLPLYRIGSCRAKKGTTDDLQQIFVRTRG